MSEFLKRAVATGATGAMLLSGCASPQGESIPSQPRVERSLKEINPTRPPLPASVGKIASNTVEVEIPTANSIVNVATGTIIDYKKGTDKGVKIVLTTAHTIAGNPGKCGTEKVTYPYTETNKSYVSGSVAARSWFPKPPKTENYVSGQYGGYDTAVLIPSDPDLLRPYEGVPLPEHTNLNVGDQGFFLGFGPRSAAFDPSPASSNKAEAQPVIGSGIVLAVDNGHVDFLFTGDYTPNVIDGLMAGDSGSPFVDSSGNYLGNIVSGTESNSVTGAAIESAYGVNLPEKFESNFFGVGEAQLMDQSKIDTLVSQIQPCTR